jgi:hypothetical protein
MSGQVRSGQGRSKKNIYVREEKAYKNTRRDAEAKGRERREKRRAEKEAVGIGDDE